MHDYRSSKVNQIDFEMLVTKFCSLGQSFVSVTWIFWGAQSPLIVEKGDSYY